MKLIEIYDKTFRLKGDGNVYYCFDADSDINMNVKAVHYVRANSDGTLPDNWTSQYRYVLRGNDLRNIEQLGDALGMPYMPVSTGVNTMHANTPDNMGGIHEALEKLKTAVGGDVTAFVCERLQWSRKEVKDKLFGEQVDAVALAIYNFEARHQTMIVGDQTGIGKGRIASSIIRYAKVNGYVPVYCTEAANLFSDNYRDMRDIGCGDYVPFIVNNKESKSNIMYLDENDNEVVVYSAMENGKEKTRIFKSGQLPVGYDYVLTTYSQLAQTWKKSKKKNEPPEPGRDFDKYDFLRSLAPRAIFVIDEAHNVAGSKVSGGWGGDESVDGSTQFRAFKELIERSFGTLFLSATYAKRPENMLVYSFKNCLSDARLDDVQLINAITQGGEALQEVISANLTQEGQLIRRESNQQGIKVNYINLTKKGQQEFADEFFVPDLEQSHRAKFDGVTQFVEKLNNFEKNFVEPYFDSDDFRAYLDASGFDTAVKNDALKVQHAPIFSKLFQIVSQLAFAVKAEAAAEHAIQRIRQGYNVVICVANTMGSFFKDMEIEDDGEIRCDFNYVMRRAADNSLYFTLKGEGNLHRREKLDVNKLPVAMRNAYFDLINEIEATSSGVTLSPIDLIAQKIEAQGFTCLEVTGRSEKIMFTNPEYTKGKFVKFKRITRSAAFSRFQNNKANALIINVAGSTGASAHATTKDTNLTPAEVRKRCMIIVQAELDINKEVQKRGRINRTGQIYAPTYDYLISGIPAEQRMMMMLQKKLKSLDANTASNQKQSTSIIDVPDFMNRIGSKLAANYLAANPIINTKLNEPINLDDEGDDKNKKIWGDELIRKITGAVPMLKCSEQEDFYNEILANYDKEVEYEKERGTYDLEVEAINLDAIMVGTEKLFTPATTGMSVFGEKSVIADYDCKSQKKPYIADEVRAMIAQYLNGRDGKAVARDIADKYRQFYEERKQRDIEEYTKKMKIDILEQQNNWITAGKSIIDFEQKKQDITNSYQNKIEKTTSKYESWLSKARLIENLYAGRALVMETSDNTLGVCLGVHINENSKTNPYAPSAIIVDFALISPERNVHCNLADKDAEYLQTILRNSSGLSEGFNKVVLDDWNRKIALYTGGRERRRIITGNILAATKKAYDDSESKWRLARFTKNDGSVELGLISPPIYGGQQNKKDTIDVSVSTIVDELENLKDSTFRLSRGCFIHISSDDVRFEIPNSAEGKVLLKMEEWALLQVSFSQYYRGGNYMCWCSIDNELDKIKDIAKVFDKYALYAEVETDLYEKLFAGRNKTRRIVSNWKPLAVDYSKIPSDNISELKSRLKAKLVRLQQFEHKAVAGLV
ncbi:MAG: strawberry notch C-terminal domain-containing protein [Bacteroidales bacterium]|nr:strawberry notch C-terminal domain-containing protein [Bacteroidales bacterium]